MQVGNDTDKAVEYSIPGAAACEELQAFSYEMINFPVMGKVLAFYEDDSGCKKELARSATITGEGALILLTKDGGSYVVRILKVN